LIGLGEAAWRFFEAEPEASLLRGDERVGVVVFERFLAEPGVPPAEAEPGGSLLRGEVRVGVVVFARFLPEPVVPSPAPRFCWERLGVVDISEYRSG
jgi:hypothetical protein